MYNFFMSSSNFFQVFQVIFEGTTSSTKFLIFLTIIILCSSKNTCTFMLLIYVSISSISGLIYDILQISNQNYIFSFVSGLFFTFC